jgi:hypothetical protein
VHKYREGKTEKEPNVEFENKNLKYEDCNNQLRLTNAMYLLYNGSAT